MSEGEGGNAMISFSFHEREAPDDSLVTGVMIIPFVGNQCLMADVRHRPGYEFPAGHSEPDESPEQTASRELMEETGARAESLHRFGHALAHNDGKLFRTYPFTDSPLVVFAAVCQRDGVGEDLQHESSGVLLCSPAGIRRR